MVIKATVDTAEARAFIRRLKEELAPEKVDKPVEVAALKTMTEAVRVTKAVIGVRPDGRRWNIEKPENKWTVRKTGIASRSVENRSKVMLWLDRGTAGGGTGFITPKRKKWLFIPLTRAAAGGWHPGLRRARRAGADRRGRAIAAVAGDYALAKKVRGIRPRNVVAQVEPFARETLEIEMRKFTKAAVARANAGNEPK